MTSACRAFVFVFSCLSGARVLAQAPAANAHHEISGIVVNAKSGEPLADTSITAIKSSNRRVVVETLSDATGRFRFSDIADGKYDLIASRKGYVTSAYQQHEGGINTAIVTGDRLISTGLLFQLDPQARVYGTIQEDSGDPVPQAQVKLFQKDIYRGTGKLVLVKGESADAMGNFEINGLSPGNYIVCVVATPWYALSRRSFPGMQPPAGENGLARLNVLYAPTCYPDTTSPAEAVPIAVAAGEQVPLNITLHPVPAFHVSMPIPARDDGQPFLQPPQVNTTIFGTTQFIPAQISFARDDPNGPYTANIDLPPGEYELRFPGQNGEPGRSMSINTDAGSSTLTMSASDPNPDPLVTGTVQTENGEPLPGNSFVWLESIDNAANQGDKVNPDGTFTMQSVQPGVYHVSANSNGGSPLGIARLNAKGAQVHGHSLTVSGEPVQLNIVLRPSDATLSGIVRKNGTPAPGVFVLLVPTGAQQTGDRAMPNQSDSDGTFNFFRVPPGDYTVVAIENGWKLDWAKADTIKPYLARGEQVRVEPQMREVNLKESLPPLPLNLKSTN